MPPWPARARRKPTTPAAVARKLLRLVSGLDGLPNKERRLTSLEGLAIDLDVMAREAVFPLDDNPPATVGRRRRRVTPATA